MKVLICINSLVKGGAERVVANLANYLSYGNQVTIVTLANYEVQYEFDSNIEIIPLDKKKKNSYQDVNKIYKIITKIPRTIKRLRKMRKCIDKQNPDIIISFLPESSFLVLYNMKRNMKKVIVSVRNDPKIEYSSGIYEFLMKKLYPRASGFVFQTKQAQDYFKNIINCESEIIPNPINSLFIKNSFEGIRRKEIVSVGRFTEQKNFLELIETFSLLSPEFNEYKLVIYGDGELRSRMEKLVKSLNLENRVVFPGVVDDLYNRIYESAVFVLPSIYEGMPNSLMEAMALGLPVISTDCPCGGPKMLIENNVSGKLVQVNNRVELKEAIEEILRNEDFAKILGKNASRISEKMNPQKINKQWENYIINVLNREEKYEK